ncbi:hypothetical protein KDN24_20800 [Bacillus sp. Bva_UNVM-123]|uniref:hypothetical protein n=1 Tax=Bacillus sp. Bva_UNVM-123 TaxID=2829798 RepID=UPI00391FB099
MEIREKKKWLYDPTLDIFIKVDCSLDEIKKGNTEEANKENEEKKELKKLQRRILGRVFVKLNVPYNLLSGMGEY